MDTLRVGDLEFLAREARLVARLDGWTERTGRNRAHRPGEAARLALLHAISENPDEPLITEPAVRWGWAIVEHLTKRLLFQASVYVHDNEFDALRQKALRYLRNYGVNGSLTHGQLLRYLHIDSETFRRMIDTLLQSELIAASPLSRGGFRYTLL